MHFIIGIVAEVMKNLMLNSHSVKNEKKIMISEIIGMYMEKKRNDKNQMD